MYSSSGDRGLHGDANFFVIGIGASVGCAEVGGVCEGTGRGGEDQEMNEDLDLREWSD